MVQSKAKTVDAYLAELPEDRREAMDRIRAIARKTLVGFEERMEYGMPTFRRSPSVGLAFASQVQYISLYVGEQVIAKHRARLRKLKVGKGCVRFVPTGQIDYKLIESLFLSAR
ncbi:MAG TPA: DUF1801 domain-containing protein [Thermoplasmata archaeon]|nr:DUF1801 domain-containing protein [Thermoplasmata archaeon]